MYLLECTFNVLVSFTYDLGKNKYFLGHNTISKVTSYI